MPASDILHHPLIEKILVDREGRQRRSIDIGDLIPSVRARGVLHPILVDPQDDGTFRLVAGERRLETARFLAHATIPARFLSELDPLELECVELEENIKRKNLTWQEEAIATLRIHKNYSAREEDWDDQKTANILGIDVTWLKRLMFVAEALNAKDPAILAADGISAARTILERRNIRAQGEALNRVMEVENETEHQAPVNTGSDVLGGSGGTSGQSASPSSHASPSLPPPPPYSIQHADTLEFFSTYSGQKFNFLHVDFPYGVELNEQAGQDNFDGGGYDSNPEIYWKLCESLANNWDRILYPNAHLLFWISMNFYTSTREFFLSRAGAGSVPHDLVINPTPMIWHKTDNRGILPDRMRGPRNIYEAALIMTTGDRHIVKPISNVYGAPTVKGDEALHTNEKPEPMLRQFLSMFIDQHSRVLDPTCGSGSSIRAAESLGAEYALGIDHNQEFVERAQAALVRARNLRSASSLLTSDSE